MYKDKINIFYIMDDTRKKIIEIYQNTRLTNQEKMKQINQLMNLGTKEIVVENNTNIEQNPEIKTCQHYHRKCMILSPCCQKWYSCRICHDEEQDHKLDRTQISTIICHECKTIQPESNQCTNCSIVFADYYCSICKLWAGDNIDIYHCPDCKICRLGKGIGIDRYHCSKCNICIHLDYIDDHQCFKHSIDSNCAVCQKYMWDSREQTVFLPCGHCIHQECLSNLSNSSFQCPNCKKSIYKDMNFIWEQIEVIVKNQIMPEEYQNWKSTITCHDCLIETTDIPYHFIYHKCSNCNGYNTSLVSIQKE